MVIVFCGVVLAGLQLPQKNKHHEIDIACWVNDKKNIAGIHLVSRLAKISKIGSADNHDYSVQLLLFKLYRNIW